MPDADPLYPQYKRARNKLRAYEPISMAGHLIGALRQAHKGGVELIRKYQPWHILLALKWTFQEVDGLAHRRPQAQVNDANQVLNILHRADDALPSSFSHPTLFLRQKAFQQFWIFQPADGSALARQEILFGKLESNHLFARQFKESTGVCISDYLELTFGLMALLLSDEYPGHFTRSNFRNLEPRMNPQAIDAFFKHLARTLTELQSWLNKPEFKNVAVADQFVLPSPLNQVPLLKVGDRYHVYYPPQLYRALEQAIYRPLRAINPAEFGRCFGPMFESYVGSLMTDAGVPFTNEAGLNAQLQGTGKVVDFLVVEADCNILIDAKGVEMSTTGRTATTAKQLYSTVKNSAMKAVEQGMETLRRIERTPPGIPRGQTETFLIVVTFESLYLGSSSDVGRIFDDSLGADLQKSFGQPYPFPLENVFFLSIREFEDLLSRVRKKTTSILQALRLAKAADADLGTRKFDFKLHLIAMGESEEPLPFIETGLDRLQSRCSQRLQATSS